VKWFTGELLSLNECLPRLKEFVRSVWDTGECVARIPATLVAVEDEPFYEWVPEDYDGSMTSMHAWRTDNGAFRRESRSDANNIIKRLPLAPIAAPGFRYDALQALFREVPPAADFLKLVDWMTTDTLARALARKPPTEPRAASKTRSSRHIGLAEIRELLRTQTVEYAVSRGARGFVTAFKVPKGEAHARLVIDGRPFDDLMRAAEILIPPMPKPGLFIREVVDRLLDRRAKVIATVDAKSMFYQFSTPQSLRTYFVLNKPSARLAQHQHIRLAVLPMGIGFAPAWAQHVSQFLVEVARSRFPPTDAQWWDAAIWIDNFIFVADGDATLARARSIFEGIASEVNLILKPWEGGSHRLEALGIALDTRQRTARITPKSHAILSEFDRQLHRTMSVKTFLHFFGHAGFLTYAIARHPLCLIPRAMGHLRRIGRARGALEEIHLSDPDIAEARSWIAALKEAEYTPLPYLAEPREVGYATDASTTGVGIVGYRDVTFSCARMLGTISPTSIHLGEMAAGLLAAFTCGAEGSVWTTDNKIAFHAMLKGHSGSEAVDEILRLWIAVAPLPRAVRWVPTTLMPADGLSRGEEPTVEELQGRPWMSYEPIPVRWIIRRQ
jgi:hypothetical protein